MPESIKKPRPLRTNNHTIVPKNPLILLATLCLTLQGCQSFIGMLVALLSLDTATAVFHNPYQPVQVLYFNATPSPRGSCNVMPPNPAVSKSTIIMMAISTVSYPLPFDHIRIVHYRAVYPILQPAIRYTVHIVYTNMMCRASHRSVEAVTHGFAHHENEYTVLINTDPWWIYLHNQHLPFPPSPHRMTHLFTTSSKKIHNSKKNCNFVF